MSRKTAERIVALMEEAEGYLARLSSVKARMDRLPEADLDGLQSLAHTASLNASDLMETMDDLAAVAMELRCKLADAEHDRARRASILQLVNFNSAGSAL